MKVKKGYEVHGVDLVFVIVNHIVLVLAFLLTLYPIIFVLSASISSPAAVAAGRMVLFPVEATFEGYKYVFVQRDLWVGYGNTIFYTVVGTCLNLAVTLPCAYGLSRKNLPGRKFLMLFFIFTMYFQGGLIPSYLNINSFGLVNTRAIMVILGLVNVFNLIVARSFFENTIPEELYEAAKMDGASDFGVFFKIIMPLSKPIVVVLLLYYGVNHWNSYFNAMIFLRDHSKFPLQLILREILILSSFSMNLIEDSGMTPEEMSAILKQQDTANLLKYAVIVVSTLPMMVIYPQLQKYFAKGVMIGSVKG